MRVLQVIDHLNRSDDVTRLLDLCTRISEKKCALEIHSLAGPGDAEELFEAAGLEPTHAARHLWNPLLKSRLRKRLARGHYAIVHAHGERAWELCQQLRGDLGRTKLVLQANRATGRQYAAPGTAKRAEESAADLVLGASNLVLSAIPPGIPKQLLYNAVDLERYSPVNASRRAELRNELDLDADAFIAGTVVTEPHASDPARLMVAAARLRDHAPQMRVVVLHAAPLGRRLRQSARHHGMLDRTSFYSDLDALPRCLAVLDTLVETHRTQALTTSLQQAMATGITCTAPDHADAAEVITPRTDGMLYTWSDKGTLEGALRKLINDRCFSAKCAEAARKRASAMFSVDTAAHKLTAIYEDLLEPPA
jgi:glycosyltransferase involved in cell wall biosynthesis